MTKKEEMSSNKCVDVQENRKSTVIEEFINNCENKNEIIKENIGSIINSFERFDKIANRFNPSAYYKNNESEEDIELSKKLKDNYGDERGGHIGALDKILEQQNIIIYLLSNFQLIVNETISFFDRQI